MQEPIMMQCLNAQERGEEKRREEAGEDKYREHEHAHPKP